MTDIVERLRDKGMWCDNDVAATMLEAAEAVETLRLRLSSVLQWTENWNCPWEGEDEWRGDLKLAKDALRKL